MRYPDGGGLSAKGRARREKVRLRAAQMFNQGIKLAQVARLLRVSTTPAYQWRRRWRSGGEAALASKGAGGNACRLDDAQLARLRAALDLGPAAYGLEGRPAMAAGPDHHADHAAVPCPLHAARRCPSPARPGP